MEFSNRILELVAEAEAALKDTFAEIDRVSFSNTKKVSLSAASASATSSKILFENSISIIP